MECLLLFQLGKIEKERIFSLTTDKVTHAERSDYWKNVGDCQQGQK